jgi:cyclic-di-AMP phosphodiesterase PgpH
MDSIIEPITIDKKWMDQSYPLLDKFRTLASGTFKHCQNVSLMCETVAVELDLNVDVLKLAAMYHDIGKINNPLYFSENQDDNNIHDKLDPVISHLIITRHVGDSILYLLQIPEMPSEVIQIVSQHHGDTVVQAFYNKACKEKNVTEDKFRYKCSKALTDEALILMICDSVEATARSLYNSTNGEDFISDALDKTITRLMNDQQLDNMKIGTLNLTKKILTKELESIYHKRVSYDDTKKIGEIREEKENIE